MAKPEIIECECTYLGPAGRTIHAGKKLGKKAKVKIKGTPDQILRFCINNGFEPKGAKEGWQKPFMTSRMTEAQAVKPKILTLSQIAARRAALVAKVGSEEAADAFLKTLKTAEDAKSKKKGVIDGN